MIRVLKRDSTVEPFDVHKLHCCLWRCMPAGDDAYYHAGQLAQAVEAYIARHQRRVVTSRAVFEMAVRALWQTGQQSAADSLEGHRERRRCARQIARVSHESGQPLPWDRGWVMQQLLVRWRLSPPAARALSGEVEKQVLASTVPITRQGLLDRLDELVDQFGLAPWCLLASVNAE